MIPSDRKYTREHVWFQTDGDTVKIGITDFAQESLGAIVFTELPCVGDCFQVGDTVATVESSKMVSDIRTAAAGEIVEINEALESEPERINRAPYEQFLVVMKRTVLNEMELMDASEYEATLG